MRLTNSPISMLKSHEKKNSKNISRLAWQILYFIVGAWYSRFVRVVVFFIVFFFSALLSVLFFFVFSLWKRTKKYQRKIYFRSKRLKLNKNWKKGKVTIDLEYLAKISRPVDTAKKITKYLRETILPRNVVVIVYRRAFHVACFSLRARESLKIPL